MYCYGSLEEEPVAVFVPQYYLVFLQKTDFSVKSKEYILNEYGAHNREPAISTEFL